MSFADWEMIHQGQQLDPMLQAISDFLDNDATIIEAIQRDLQRGLKTPSKKGSDFAPGSRGASRYCSVVAE
jgi:hypothetical protein